MYPKPGRVLELGSTASKICIQNPEGIQISALSVKDEAGLPEKRKTMFVIKLDYKINNISHIKKRVK